jgi:hypothetical protein
MPTDIEPPRLGVLLPVLPVELAEGLVLPPPEEPPHAASKLPAPATAPAAATPPRNWRLPSASSKGL